MRDDSQLHYRVYGRLKSKDMQMKYSSENVLVQLMRVNKLKIGDE